MKLAEALLERKSLMQRVEKLRLRLVENALVQEGDTPMEEPREMLSELNDVVMQLEKLIKRINATNNVTLLPNGSTVSEAIVRRDMLNLRRVSLEQVANATSAQRNRYSRNEIRYQPTISGAELHKEVDVLARTTRQLDAEIQAVNWSTELLE